MHEHIKYIWICLAFFTICGFIAMIPYDKIQQAYMAKYHKIKSEPQRRIDAAYEYIEHVEDGSISTENGITFEDYFKQLDAKSRFKKAFILQKKYQKPLYVRDKHNPKILHPYRGKNK